MKQPTIEQLKTEFTRLGYKWFPFMGIAIRSRANVPNKFDDLIGFVDGDKVTWHTGTTNAGTKPLVSPSNPKGVALVCPQQVIDGWELGLHKGKYLAWKQIKPVKYWRDNDLDKIAESGGEVYEGIIGINWHRANENAQSENVENWSEGCMVQNNPDQYDTFIKASSESGLLKFTGVIMDEWLISL